MARTAPTVNGTPTLRRVSFRWIDATGDKRSDQVEDLPANLLDADIEAYAVALGANSNAALYSIEVVDIYNSTADKSNAVDAIERSVFDNFVILAKNALNQSRRFYVPAPEAALFVDGTDQFDPSEGEWANILAAVVALTDSYDVVSIRYSERKEKNEAIPV